MEGHAERKQLYRIPPIPLTTVYRKFSSRDRAPPSPPSGMFARRGLRSLASFTFLLAGFAAQATIFSVPVQPPPVIEDTHADTSLQYWTRLAQKGSARAQLRLAQIYEYGEGTERNSAGTLQ